MCHLVLLFFIVKGRGLPQHSHHLKLNKEEFRYPPRLLADNTLEIIQDLRNANASLSVAVNFVYKNTGLMLTRDNVHFLSGLCADIEVMEELDPTERMIAHLEHKKFNHIIFYQNKEDKLLYNDVNPGDSMHRMRFYLFPALPTH